MSSQSALPKVTHSGNLSIGDSVFPVSVLSDGTRILSESKFMESLGMYRSGALSVRRKERAGGSDLPLSLAHKNLEPFLTDEDGIKFKPVRYIAKTGRVHNGINATAIPLVCDIWLKARDAGVLGDTQLKIAQKADLLMRALAHVGIIALIDEATGYQEDRAKDALAEILKQFISEELSKWVKTFPDDYYKQLFKLKGLTYQQFTTKRPAIIGRITNDIVYERLAPGVLEALQEKNPRVDGRRRHKHFQWLTPEIGQARLREHLAAVIALMKASTSWRKFESSLNRALPRRDQTLPLDLEEETEDD